MADSKGKPNKSLVIIPHESIENKIYLIRSRKVMVDKDIAALYGVPTKRLKEQVRRNMKRFPPDFMFELTPEEAEMLSSRTQNATLKRGQNIKYQPFVFTEHGVAMLSSVLNSDRAIEVNIQIMRTFAKLRELMISHKDLAKRLDDLEKKFKNQDEDILVIFQIIREMIQKPKKPQEPEKPKPGIGFHVK